MSTILAEKNQELGTVGGETMKKWKIDAGNSGTGPVGFCVYDIEAKTAKAALAKVKAMFPVSIEEKYDLGFRERIAILVYFNPERLTLANVEAQED